MRVRSSAAQLVRRRRPGLVVGLLTAVAGVCVLAGSFAVWIDRQLLNTDRWVSTSSRILANETVRSAVGAYLVRELLASAGASGGLGSGLPAQALGALGGGVSQVAGQTVGALLGEPFAQRAWREANRIAHRRALAVLVGHGRAVPGRGPEIVLDVHPLVRDLARQLAAQPTGGGGQDPLSGLLGLGTQALGERLLQTTIPANRGRIVILRPSGVRTAQVVVGAIRPLAIALPIAALACLALVMVLARGWRWAAMGRVGWCLLVAGLAVVAARWVLQWLVVERLLTSPLDRAAGDAAWGIATRWLLAAGLGLAVAGVVTAGTAAAAFRTYGRRRAVGP